MAGLPHTAGGAAGELSQTCAHTHAVDSAALGGHQRICAPLRAALLAAVHAEGLSGNRRRDEECFCGCAPLDHVKAPCMLEKWGLPVQLRDSLQRVREALREELSDEMRPGPWSLDVHPDEGPIPEPWEVDAELERDMKVCDRMP